LTSQAACSFPVASSVANTVLSLFRVRSESVSPARRSSCRLAQTGSMEWPPPTVDLLGAALPDFGEHVVAEFDHVKRVDRNDGAWNSHPQGLAERR
jgi:hypothetical protein